MMSNCSRAIRVLLDLRTGLIIQPRPQYQLIHRTRPSASAGSLNCIGKSSLIDSQKRNYATQRLDVVRLRADVDKSARIGYYTLTKQQNILHIEANTAHSIIEDFLHFKNKLTPGDNVRRLSEKYRVDIDDLASLAIVTFNIPDLSDPEKKAQLPPSQHKSIAGQLLQGCAEAEDPLAIMQTMGAVYLSSSTFDRSIRNIASLFSRFDIAKYRKTLEELGEKAQSFALGPDSLTLQGLYLEREGQKQKALWLYQKAIQLSHMKFNPKSRHPMLLKLVEPWNALGYLLKADQTPETQAEAKRAFEEGAFKGDDPLSYFELAAFEPRSSTKWLKYTSKAAASGHRPAIINLAEFYHEINSKDTSLLKDDDMQKTLQWLLQWKSNSAEMLGREWLQVATNIGHKPSMLKLADYYESKGKHELAKEQLRQVVKPPSAANQDEEWPQLVQVAKRRLAGLKS